MILNNNLKLTLKFKNQNGLERLLKIYIQMITLHPKNPKKLNMVIHMTAIFQKALKVTLLMRTKKVPVIIKLLDLMLQIMIIPLRKKPIENHQHINKILNHL